MRDLILFGFFALIALMGFKRPFLWVLLYIYVDLVMPQKIGWGFLTSLPISFMAFVLAFGGWLVLDSKKGSRFSFNQGLILALLVLCGLTSIGTPFPDSAWDKWNWVWKALLFAAFLPLALRTRLRIEAAALVMVLSIGAIVINGGIKTALGSGGYGSLALLVQEDAGIYEGSIISTAAICIIPLAIWLARFGTIFKPHWMVTGFVAALSFAAILVPIGTSARTGLVCAAVLVVLMLRTVRYRFVYAGVAGLLLAISIPFLPQSFTERMSTISDHEEDESASTRLAVWDWTYEFAKENPFGGGFDAFRANSFTYQLPKVVEEGNTRIIEYTEVTDEGRAYHSSYFEMLGEQGWLGLGMWLLLHATGMIQMERVRRKFLDWKDGKPRWQNGLATALQQAHGVYLFGALFVGIAFQPFGLIIVAVEIALWSLMKTRKLDKEDAARAASFAKREANGGLGADQPLSA